VAAVLAGVIMLGGLTLALTTGGTDHGGDPPAVEPSPKTRCPTTDVYGATPRPTLRLITCLGDFDRSTGHYRDNTVVHATPVARR
jgi:hypothetical protein